MADVQLRHWCTHALDHLIEELNVLGHHDDLELYHRYTREGVDMLRNSIKFAWSYEQAARLPIEQRRDWLTQDEPTLPFDTIAVEMEFGEAQRERQRESIDQIESYVDGVIYVCQHLYCAPRFVRARIIDDLDLRPDTGGWLCWAVQKFVRIDKPNEGRWLFAPVIGVSLPREEALEWEDSHSALQMHSINPGEPLVNLLHLIDAESLINSLRAHTRDADMMDLYRRTVDNLGAQVQEDMHAVAALCMMLSAANVRTKVHAAPLKLNVKREKRGREPIFEYRTIEVDLDAPGVQSISTGAGDKRRSPRLHLRRGHDRHYADGRVVKIPPMIVGDKSRGIVLKDYIIKKTED